MYSYRILYVYVIVVVVSVSDPLQFIVRHNQTRCIWCMGRMIVSLRNNA